MQWWSGDPHEREHDVIVLGSGAAGLVAAATAARSGSRTLVLEKTGFLGGTSSISAGTIWVPVNEQMAAAGRSDDPRVARAYLARQAHGTADGTILDTLVSHGRAMVAFVARECGLEFDAVMDYPDYRQDVEGAAAGGRSLQPRMFDTSALDELRDAIRRDDLPPYTMREFKEWGSWERFPWDELERRRQRGIVARGGALTAPLLAGCRDLAVSLVTGAVSTGLRRLGRGFAVSVGSEEFVARHGVVLATGGFEWDGGMRRRHFGSALAATCSPEGANSGDGHRMAARIGATLADLGEAWWAPMVPAPDATVGTVDGFGKGTLIRVERQGPGSITVGGTGRRFANESQNYNSFIRAAFAAETADPGAALPMYVVFDQRFLRTYGFLRRTAGDTLPPGVRSGATRCELAGALGIDAQGLCRTVEEFNADARDGTDRAFQRGENSYDVYSGDSANPYPNPCLAPIEEPPFYGIEIVPGAFGTAGGVRTDAAGCALDDHDAPIPGLFAVGNVARHPVAASYPGAGATLGPAMIMGFVAGQALGTSCVEP